VELKRVKNMATMVFCFFVILALNAGAEAVTMAAKDKDRTVVESDVSGEGCTLEKFSIFSKSMDREIKVIVILPPEYKANPGKKYPILYTLHGASAPYGTFSEMGPLRKALKSKPMIITCLDGDKGSWYLDSANLQKDYSNEEKKKGAPKLPPVKSLFTTFFFDEFIPCLDKYYRVNPAQRMITGFSMGGFGAFHYMLLKPKMFASISSLSGAFFSLSEENEGARRWMTPLLGSFSQNREKYEATDLFKRITKCAEAKEKLPPIFLHCGTEDGLLAANKKMNSYLEKSGYNCKYLESPGKHDWKFWVGAIEGVLDFHWKTLQ